MRRSVVTSYSLVIALAITGCQTPVPSQAGKTTTPRTSKAQSKATGSYALSGGSRVETALQLSEPTSGEPAISYATEAQVMNAVEAANAAVVQAAGAEARAAEALQKARDNEAAAQDALQKAQEASSAAAAADATIALANAKVDAAAAAAAAAEAKANTVASQAALLEAKSQNALERAIAANDVAAQASAAASLAEAKAQNAAATAAAADVKALAADAKAAAAEAKAISAATAAQTASSDATNAATAAQAALAAASNATAVAEAAASKSAAIDTTLKNLKKASVNVLDFGAKGDSTTDDTAAIQAAIDYAESIKGGVSLLHGAVVVFPPGQYRTKGGLKLRKGITLEGVSENGSVLRWDGTAAATENILYCLGILGDRATAKQIHNVYVNNMAFGMLDATSHPTRKPFIFADYAVEPTFKNVRTAGLNTLDYVNSTGMLLIDSINVSISGFVNDGGWSGIEMQKGASNLGVRACRFDNMHIYGTRGSGLVMNTADYNVFSNTLIETYSTTAAGTAGALLTNCDRNNFNGLSVITSNSRYANGIRIDGDSYGNIFSGVAINGASDVGFLVSGTADTNSIHGGTISNSGTDGVTIKDSASNNTLSNLTAITNAQDGFEIATANARNNSFIGCVAKGNGAVGFKATDGSNSTCIAGTAVSNPGGEIGGKWALMQQGGTFTGTSLVANGSLAVGGGTPITKVAVYTPTLTPAPVPANSTSEQTFTVPGLTTADTVTLTPPVALGFGLVVTARVSAPDTLAVQFGNLSSGSVTPATGAYRVLAIRI